MTDMLKIGWRENTIYPGTHWLYYNERYDYLARVDFNDCTRGLYQWRVMQGFPWHDIIGWEPTLEAAQSAAERVMAHKSVQLRLAI